MGSGAQQWIQCNSSTLQGSICKLYQQSIWLDLVPSFFIQRSTTHGFSRCIDCSVSLDTFSPPPTPSPPVALPLPGAALSAELRRRLSSLTSADGKRHHPHQPPPSPARGLIRRPARFHSDLAVPVEQMGFTMTGSEDVKGLAASLGELQVEASPSSPSREKEIDWPGNGDAAATDDDVWDDAAILDRDWAHRKNQFVKMGYRDGITEGQKDAAQEGFNIGFGQSVHVGYKWGLVRGITSALGSLPDSLKEKLLLDGQRKGELEDLHNSVQGISSEGALRLFHESILQDNNPPEENRLQTVPSDLLLLLNECPDVQVPEELTRVP